MTSRDGWVDRPIIDATAAQSKAKVANSETTQSRFRDSQAALSDRKVSGRARNETIGGIVLLVCIVVVVFILFFVF